MSLDGAYEPDNVFARIIQGELPAVRVYEDEQVLAFMDAFPQSRGHCLVISKKSKARNLLEAEPQALTAVMLTVQRLAGAVRDALDPDGIAIAQFNGSVAGQTVFHLHVHVIPRWRGQPAGLHAAGDMADPGELEAIAAPIRAAMNRPR